MIRGARDRADGRTALHLVGVWADDSGPILAQVGVANKSNAIAAIPALRHLLNSADCIVTIGALGCQTAIAAQLVDQGGNYVLALKDNHPALHDVRRTFAEARADGFAGYTTGDHDEARTVGKEHAQLAIRSAWALRDPDLLPSLDPDGCRAQLRAIGRIEAGRKGGAAVAVARHH